VVLSEDQCIIEERIQSRGMFNPDIFTEQQLDVMRLVALKLGGKSAAELTKMTHEEPLYSKCSTGKEIPYELAKEIRFEI